MVSMGIVSTQEQETLWEMAKRCAKTIGGPSAVAFAIMGSKAGSIVVPGIGTVSGAVVAALGGLMTGTMSCMMVNYAVQDELRRLARGK